MRIGFWTSLKKNEHNEPTKYSRGVAMIVKCGASDEAPLPTPSPPYLLLHSVIPRVFTECIILIKWQGNSAMNNSNPCSHRARFPLQESQPETSNYLIQCQVPWSLVIWSLASEIYLCKWEDKLLSFLNLSSLRPPGSQLGSLVYRKEAFIVQPSLCLKTLTMEQSWSNHRITIFILYYLVSLTRDRC